MSDQVAQTPEALRRRVRYFLFESRRRGRREVFEFAQQLSQLGSVAIIGGMLRDLAYSGNQRFASDVDFVAKPSSIQEFDSLMQSLGATLNRFGGYRLTLRRWKVDVWPIERTWASQAGHLIVRDFADLLGATFFDWDAVVFDIERRSIIALPDYFERLAAGVIDVNLRPNPNPVGNAIRALRYAYKNDLAFGKSLANHVFECVSEHDWEQLIAQERRSFGTTVLEIVDRNDILYRLRDSSGLRARGQIKPFAEQYRLPLGKVYEHSISRDYRTSPHFKVRK